MSDISLSKLWQLDDLIKERWGRKFYNHIDYCGLIPVRDPGEFNYDCTPKNSLIFASTGGNGVHFGIINGANGTKGPIVMTSPMAEVSNMVIAENLEEFFSIGFHVGWFALEQLAYDRDDTIKYQNQPDPDLNAAQIRFLELVRSHFNLSHSPLSTNKLEWLQNEYFHHLEIDN